MPENATARHFLPNLYVGQSQKELTHNEGLARIDALLHPVVEAKATTPPAALTDASDGLCWLIDDAPAEQWLSRSGQIARWSGGSWRYIVPVEGMVLWLRSQEKRLFYIENTWVEPDAINSPASGTIIDIEARAAVTAILDHLRQIGSIP